jgi:hypothetical protein
MVNRVGLLWTSNSIPPSQEHYITNFLRQKLFTAIDSLPLESDGANVWILFLPEEEFHEIGLLFANYLLRSNKKKVIYLGPNVPLSSVENTLADFPAANLLLFMVHRDLPENSNNYLSDLLNKAKGSKLYVASRKEEAQAIGEKQNLQWLYSVKDLEQELERPETMQTLK